MEVQRLLSVLNEHLRERSYVVGEEYTVADMCLFPWARQVRIGYKHTESGISASELLSFEENYPHIIRWLDLIGARPAVQRGITVCSWTSEHTKPWLAAAASAAP
jgi:GST-like protein